MVYVVEVLDGEVMEAMEEVVLKAVLGERVRASSARCSEDVCWSVSSSCCSSINFFWVIEPLKCACSSIFGNARTSSMFGTPLGAARFKLTQSMGR